MPDTGPSIASATRHALSYEARLATRAGTDIDTIVLHCTELPDLATAREFGERIHYPQSGTGNSGHYYLDRDGAVHEWVTPLRIAHHCRGWNARSIGIELVNTGRYPHWLDARHQAMSEPYTKAQLGRLIDVLKSLRATFASITQIAGHEDLDVEEVPATDDASLKVRRKRDPGPLFPWGAVLAQVPLRRLGSDT